MTRTEINQAFVGAAVGTLIGAISAYLIPTRDDSADDMMSKVRHQTQGFAEKALNVGEGVLNGMKRLKEPNMTPAQFLKGTLLGLAIGAASVAFLSPKSGRQLRNEFFNAYQEVSDKAQELGRTLRYSNPLKDANKIKNTLRRKAKSVVKKAKHTAASVKKDAVAAGNKISHAAKKHTPSTPSRKKVHA